MKNLILTSLFKLVAGTVTFCALIVLASPANALSLGYGECEGRANIEGVSGATSNYAQIDGERHGPTHDPISIKADDGAWWAPPGYTQIITPPVSLGYGSIAVDPTTNSLSGQVAANGFNMPGGQGNAFGYLKGIYEIASDTLPTGTSAQISASIDLGGRFGVYESTGPQTFGFPTMAREMLLLTRLPTRPTDNWDDPNYYISDQYYLDTIPPINEGIPGLLGFIDAYQEPDPNNMVKPGIVTGFSRFLPGHTVPDDYGIEVETYSQDMTVDLQVGDIIMMETILELWATSPRGGDGSKDEVWTDYGNTLTSSISAVTDNVSVVDYGNGDGTPPPIPEPTTWLLLGSGLLGLAIFGRKKLFN